MRVTILEMTPAIGNGIEAITRRWLVKALRAAGAQILTGARVTAIEPGRVLYETSDGAPGSVKADLVALAVGWRPRGDRLAAVLDGREVVVVGDAHSPADFVAATSSGGLAALTI